MSQIEIVAEFDNLYRAYRRVRMCNCGTVSALRFEKFALEGIDRLQRLLLTRTYTMGPYLEFDVDYPKKRHVKACCFKDKIIQHSLCKNVLWPEVNKHLISDNYASREGMGTQYAINRFKRMLHNYYINFGNVGYLLKIDVRKYFYSINLNILKQQMRRYNFDEGALWLIDIIIDSMCHEERNGVKYGVPIGNQTSQCFAVQYLNGIDHYIKDQLGVKYYGRYMDDSFVLCRTKQEAQSMKQLITAKYKEYDLELNEKTQIIPIHKGITFLGRRFSMSPTGKITERLTNQNIRHRYKEIHKKAQQVATGEITCNDYWTSFVAWNGYAHHADTYKIRMRLYHFAKEELENAVDKELRNSPAYKSGIPIRS